MTTSLHATLSTGGPPGSPRGRRVAILAMIGSAACWGLATVLSRDILARMAPPTLLVIQLVASVTVLSVLAIRERPRGLRGAGLGRAALAGMLEPGLTYTLGLIGLGWTTAGHASVISAAEPVFTVLLAWLLLRQLPSARLLTGIALAIAGLILVSSQSLGDGGGQDGAEAGQARLRGDLLIIVATGFAAVYAVVSSRFVARIPAATLAVSQQVVGLAVAVVVYLVARQTDWFAGPRGVDDPGLLLYAAFSGVMQYALPFWLYLIGLRHLTPGVAGLWLTLVPVFGLAGAYLLLGEEPTLPMLAGAVIIIAAVLMGKGER